MEDRIDAGALRVCLGPESGPALALRGQVFRGGGDDRDGFDDQALHLTVADGDRVFVCARVRLGEVCDSYSAQFYDLAGLSAMAGAKLELGRFCMAPGRHDADALRLIWAMLTRVVDRQGVGMIYGCASFQGVEAAPYAAAFADLGARHLAPLGWRPGMKAAETFSLQGFAADPSQALRQLPPLLRSYLSIGGKVSDHAVIDRDLGTIHVFCGLEVASVPPARAASLRRLAG
ncbi:GNAT family N-acyltransferase [Neogemmobacter tilapiae]|uniref:L-ornithine N(alpha)-acyltransferase n=1 Tax=Neogemmobacter tilapiae TaxID=875041 RepID=A0A918TER0_9RHOB|nr:GNAT family N-acyltransferase [Gemmobacter tilapiae]GHC44406.1 ornithine-acyl-ACP acyltransferase [Gemmobacter tilapiae]